MARDFGAKPKDFPPPGGEAAGATRDFGAKPVDFLTPGGRAARTAPLLEKISKLVFLFEFVITLLICFCDF